VVVGVVLGLGLYLAVRKLVTAGVLATEPDPAAWWLSARGLAAVYAAQAAAVLFGAVIAGAGRVSGAPLGLAVGVVCGGLFLGFELLTGVPARDLVFYLQPPVLALLGLVTGAAGARVWTAPPVVEVPPPPQSKLSSLCLTPDALAAGRPTVWWRVLAGALVMTLGVAFADTGRKTLQKYSGGTLRVQSQGQGKFITGQLATLAVLGGAVLAAAGTGAGVRHGLLAGLIGGAGVLAVCARAGEAVPPVEYWLGQTTLDGLPLTAPAVIATIAGGVLLLGVVGGWFGGKLFLPLAPSHLRNRLRGGLD
jgi:hypothetical protein